MKTTTKRRGFKSTEQRCCPTCLRPMKSTDGVWVCEKHGGPNRP